MQARSQHCLLKAVQPRPFELAMAQGQPWRLALLKRPESKAISASSPLQAQSPCLVKLHRREWKRDIVQTRAQ